MLALDPISIATPIAPLAEAALGHIDYVLVDDLPTLVDSYPPDP